MGRRKHRPFRCWHLGSCWSEGFQPSSNQSDCVPVVRIHLKLAKVPVFSHKIINNRLVVKCTSWQKLNVNFDLELVSAYEASGGLKTTEFWHLRWASVASESQEPQLCWGKAWLQTTRPAAAWDLTIQLEWFFSATTAEIGHNFAQTKIRKHEPFLLQIWPLEMLCSSSEPLISLAISSAMRSGRFSRRPRPKTSWKPSAVPCAASALIGWNLSVRICVRVRCAYTGWSKIVVVHGIE